MTDRAHRADREKEPLIVVGVDGSDPSKEALRWAIREAELRKAKVLAIHAWTYPLAMAYSPYVPGLAVQELQKSEEAVVADMVAQSGAGPVESRSKRRRSRVRQRLP